MKYMYACIQCGSSGGILFKETDEFMKSQISYCPFCGSDISEDGDDFELGEEYE